MRAEPTLRRAAQPDSRGLTALPAAPVTPPSPDILESPSTANALRQRALIPSQVRSRALDRVVTTAALRDMPEHMVVDSAVLQVWEGTVKYVDQNSAAIDVVLRAKIGIENPHTARISFEWIADQDRDLVRPGAVFYLTLYKRTQKGSIQNSQELRFRRRPAWSRQQVAAIHQEADNLLKKLVERPRAQ